VALLVHAIRQQLPPIPLSPVAQVAEVQGRTKVLRLAVPALPVRVTLAVPAYSMAAAAVGVALALSALTPLGMSAATVGTVFLILTAESRSPTLVVAVVVVMVLLLVVVARVVEVLVHLALDLELLEQQTRVPGAVEPRIATSLTAPVVQVAAVS
jgi:hypothetical protein